MYEDDSDKDRRKQSLLSHGAPAPDPYGARGYGSMLAVNAATNENDPALRHRLARSRREAEPSPLLSALAAMEGFRAEPVVEQDADRLQPRPAAEPKKSRWSFRDLLSPKLKIGQPEAERPRKPRKADRLSATGEARAAAIPAQPARSEPAPDVEDEPEVDEPRVDEQEIEEAASPPRAISRLADRSPDDPRWKPLIDPVSVIGGIGRSKKLIAATTLIGAAIGVAIALSTPKKYEAFAELLIDPRDLKLSDRDLTQTGLPNDATLAIVENQVRVLTSGTVLNRVVDKLNLTEDSEFNGQREGGIGNVFSSLRALLSSGNGAGGDAGDRRRALAVGNLAESLHVERGGKTFVVSIGAITEEPEKSALIANTLIEVFFKAYGELLSNTAGRATDELQAKLEELRAGLDEAERKVEKYRAEHDLVDAQGKLISDDELVKLNEQLSIARARTIELNARAAVDPVDQRRGGAWRRLAGRACLVGHVGAALAICRDETGGRSAFGPARAAPSAISGHAGAAQRRARADRQRIAAHRRLGADRPEARRAAGAGPGGAACPAQGAFRRRQRRPCHAARARA